MRRTFLLLAFSGCIPWFAVAQAAQVEALQAPVWVERAGQNIAARPGMELREADALLTGTGGRLLVRLADGGFVKLGENTRLVLDSLNEDASSDVLKGLFSVVKGVFRYTTGILGRKTRRDIELRVATATIGIRGTDVWGRSQDGGATVCLIEGQITVHHPARGEFVMDQPSSFFVAPRQGEPLPVAPVEADKLARWAAETDLAPGQGVLLPGGGWSVQLGSYGNEAAARDLERQLLDAGIPVELTTVQVDDRTFHRLRVSGFDTQEDAQRFAEQMKGRPATAQPWVTCNMPGSSCR
jgi:hypothetical protein